MFRILNLRGEVSKDLSHALLKRLFLDKYPKTLKKHEILFNLNGVNIIGNANRKSEVI